MKKILHYLHWACMGSMILMSGGAALALAGAGTSFGTILSGFFSHIITGFTQYVVPGFASLATASGNMLGFIGLPETASAISGWSQGLVGAKALAAVDPHILHHSFQSVVSAPAGAAPAALSPAFHAATATTPPLEVIEKAARLGLSPEEYLYNICPVPGK